MNNLFDFINKLFLLLCLKILITPEYVLGIRKYTREEILKLRFVKF